MSKEFTDILKELFPPISDKTKENLTELILQHKKDSKLIFSSILTADLSQGDVITNMPFLTLQENGKYIGKRMYAMLLSNTCDFANNKTVLLAPAYEIDFYEECFKDNPKAVKDLRANIIYDKFFLPSHTSNNEIVIDFNGINSFEKNYIKNNMEKSESKKIASLSQTGYYYLITKLTVHFLRPETEELIREQIV